MDEISIVVRTMPGREAFLERCLFLLSAQFYAAVEVVVVAQRLRESDDLAAIEQAIGRWHRRFSHTQLLSHVSSTDARSKSLNMGKHAARGRYLAFLDDDDKVYPDHYEELVAALRRRDRAWAFADVVRALFNEQGQLIERTAPFRRTGDSFLDHARGNSIPIHSFVIDTKRAGPLGVVDETMSKNEDYDFVLRLACRHEPLYVRRFGAEYCIRSDGSNTVLTGTSADRADVREAWARADAVMFNKKLATLGWWIRELDSLPPVHSPDQRLVGPSSKKPRTGEFALPPDADRTTAMRDQFALYHGSRSWRLTAPLRHFVCWLQRRSPIIDAIPVSEREASERLLGLLSSTSWELTAPLRFAKRVARGCRRRNRSR